MADDLDPLLNPDDLPPDLREAMGIARPRRHRNLTTPLLVVLGVSLVGGLLSFLLLNQRREPEVDHSADHADVLPMTRLLQGEHFWQAEVATNYVGVRDLAKASADCKVLAGRLGLGPDDTLALTAGETTLAECGPALRR